ncbi:hypothetical protein BH24CHL3_BH24CHL3_07400 [soil metagenome]
MTAHTDDFDFQQFAGRFDAPVAPSPTFAADLRNKLGVETAPASHSPFAIAIESVQPGMERDAGVWAMGVEPWRGATWMRALEAVVATLVVLSLVVSSVYFRQPGALFDLVFQPAPDSNGTEINFGGDSGRTWVLGDVGPDTAGYRIDPNIPLADMQFSPVGYYRLLVGDSIVFAGSDSSEGNLVRYDLERSEKVWTSSAIAAGQLASDGEHIFAFESDTMPAKRSATLIAIDFATGDVVWEGPELASEPDSSSSLALSNGAVFATDYLGNVVAVNSDDGSLIWQFPDTFAVPLATEDSDAGESSYLAPEIVANDESVFVRLPSMAVRKLDREDGADLGSIDLLDDYGADIVYTTIQVRAHRLVVAAVHAEQKGDQDDVFGFFPTNILVFDAESLQLQTRTDVQNYGGNIVLTDDAAFVPTLMEPDGLANVYRLAFDSGELGEPLLGIQSTRGMFLSVSGNVLMVTSYPSSIGFFDLDSGDLINSFQLDTPILETPFGGPVQMWGSNPIVITALGEVYVVTNDRAKP